MNLIKYLTLGLFASANIAIGKKTESTNLSINSKNFHPCNKSIYEAARRGVERKPRMLIYKTENEANTCHPFNKATVYVDNGRNYKQLSIHKVDHSLGEFNPARKECAIESMQAGLSNEFSSLEKAKQCPPNEKKGKKFNVRTKQGRREFTIAK